MRAQDSHQRGEQVESSSAATIEQSARRADGTSFWGRADNLDATAVERSVRDAATDRHESYILTLSCPDRVGIVAAITGHLAALDGFILDSQQYADLDVGRFFLRVQFKRGGPRFPEEFIILRAGLQSVLQAFEPDWNLLPQTTRPKVLIAVSKSSHCLNDLLHRWHTGALSVDVVGVVSNHQDLRELTGWYGVPYHYLPTSAAEKSEQEQQLLHAFRQHRADYLVLARYMQILSPETCEALAGRCINIHHSFLPSFKGARPYRRLGREA